MKIPFERWFEEHENDFPESAIDLFKESVLCYKIGANRSAFLMALNGFHIIIVDRLINSNVIPQTYNPQVWQNKLKELSNDDKRDEVLKGLIETEDKNKKVFLLTSQTIREYRSLRDIRNICAHGKNGCIDDYRVNQIWIFIQRNLAYFTINGGTNYLLEKIREHYDVSLTPPNQDPQYLIDDVINSIPESEYKDFIDGLYNITNKLPPLFQGFHKDNKTIKFWKELIIRDRFRKAIIDFVKKTDNNMIRDSFVMVFPETVSDFIADKKYARLLWTGNLFDTLSYSDGKWLLLREIIEKNVIPNDEKEEFENLLYRKIGKNFPVRYADILKETKYFDKLYVDLFNSGYFQSKNYIKLNNFANVIKNYLTVMPLNLEIVKNFNDIIPTLRFEAFYDFLKEWFANKNNLEDYRKIVTENGLEDLSGKFIDNTSDTEISK